MSTPIRRIWVPGFEKRIAAGSNGTLYRYKKGDKTLTPIPRKRLQLETAGKVETFSYEYLIALAFVPQPETPYTSTRFRVGFLDGNPENTAPTNLFWLVSARAHERYKKAKAHQNQAEIARILEDHWGTYRNIDQAPGYYIKEDGTLWRLALGILKRCPGHIAKSTGRIQVHLGQNHKSAYPLAEIVADIFLPPRPSPYYRAQPIDGNPGNTHPANLRWTFIARPKTIPPRFTSTHQEQRYADPSAGHFRKAKEYRESLIDQGARYLRGDGDVWMTPAGRLYILDSQRGTLNQLHPDSTGRVFFDRGLSRSSCVSTREPSSKRRLRQIKLYLPDGVNIFNLIADAFPDRLHRRRIPCQECYPKDGDWTNTSPENIDFAPVNHSYSDRLWLFSTTGTRAERESPGDAHQSAYQESPQPATHDQIIQATNTAHSETPQPVHTQAQQDDSPLDLDTFLD